MTMIYGSCNISDDTPEPTEYTLNFIATSNSGNIEVVEVMEFAKVCSSDDINITKIVVRASDENVIPIQLDFLFKTSK